MNKKPKIAEKINMPIKPTLPEKPRKEFSLYYCDVYIKELFKECTKIKYLSDYEISIDNLYKYKKEYENDYAKNYEMKFNKHYETYRIQYYEKIIKKYCNKNVYVTNVKKNQYEIRINIYNSYYNEIYSELKPELSDDYPCVLRKLKAQIQLTNDYNKKKGNSNRSIYTLIVGKFSSINVSKEQLITIFKQSDIKVIFTEELFEKIYINSNEGNTKYTIQYNEKDSLFEKKLIEENKTIRNNLLEMQEKLLHAEKEIKELEEEIQILKTPKPNKSIKDYFGKK